MSAPIRVRLGHSPVLRKIHNAWVNQGWRRKFYWHCTACTPSQFESNGGTADTLAAAADAGRTHLAAHHTAFMPPVAHGGPDGVFVAPRPLTWTPDVLCDFPCCCDHDQCRAHDNPIQRTFNTSREDC